MDYNLAALKVFCSQLNNAKATTTQQSQAAFTLSGILFQRVWLQVSFFLSPFHIPRIVCFIPILIEELT